MRRRRTYCGEGDHFFWSDPNSKSESPKTQILDLRKSENIKTRPLFIKNIVKVLNSDNISHLVLRDCVCSDCFCDISQKIL